jgi:hypothetical protein
VLGFETDIRPLFRDSDRLFMDYVFDLWDYEDVKAEAENILVRLVDRTMPCDAPWDAGRIELFRVWICEGCQP